MKTVRPHATALSLLAAAALLASCSNPEYAAERARQIEAAEHNECVSLGFKPGTESYGNCRLKQQEIRALNRQANAAYYNNPRFSVGYGLHSHHW